ncbi:ABC transporter permease [Conexibacter sp. SYSU D00693]|uniref:ABC transporter permease n=1 Tax=Conexibacter sp. SYSU D00693 TaxID=2812560 RepID=UPI00196B8175|nr:ABC transporter permease [Conexibacter sp. SYSU D00693]
MSAVEPQAVADLGTPIKGPSALGSDPRRFIRLTLTLAVTDFRLRFFGSALGYLWTLMRPLMLFGVLYIVFSEFLDFGGDVRFYPVGLLTGIVLFSFVADATNSSVRSIVMRENLVRKVEFPRLAVPLATVLTATFNLVLNLVPVFVFLLAAGGAPRWSWFQIPLLLGMLIAFVTALAMLLSALFVRARDVEPIWDVILQVLFYATPIFYTLDVVADKTDSDFVTELLVSSPFACVLQQFRHAVVDPSWQSPIEILGGRAGLLIPIGITLLLLALGSWVFAREAPRIAEDL